MACLVAHIIYRLDIGGLESVLVQFVNHCPPDQFRHVIICLTDSTNFKERITNKNVEIIALHKKEGKSLGTYFRMWRVLRHLQPDIAHTYSLPTLDCQLIAFFAGVKHRIHAEHGRSSADLDGTNWKYNLLRRKLRPLIHRWVAVSRDLHDWLEKKIGIGQEKNRLIYNGVDTKIFYPQPCQRKILPASFQDAHHFILGTIGRLDSVKNQELLLHSLRLLLDESPSLKDRLRVIIIGEGPMRKKLEEEMRRSDLQPYVWLCGARHDIPALLNCMDVFVLPSLAEGIPMTILEAMATSLPVIATRVGGNGEIIEDGISGFLIPSSSPIRLAEAINKYLHNEAMLKRHGSIGRKLVQEKFSIEMMSSSYIALYRELMGKCNDH